MHACVARLERQRGASSRPPELFELQSPAAILVNLLEHLFELFLGEIVTALAQRLLKLLDVK